MNITQKSLFDDLINILTKFGRTDETRIDEDWVYNKFNEVRAEMLKEAYRKTGMADPSWYQDALDTNLGKSQAMKFRSDVHPSEWAWIGTDFDAVLDNDGTIDDLYAQVSDLLLNHQASK